MAGVASPDVLPLAGAVFKTWRRAASLWRARLASLLPLGDPPLTDDQVVAIYNCLPACGSLRWSDDSDFRRVRVRQCGRRALCFNCWARQLMRYQRQLSRLLFYAGRGDADRLASPAWRLAVGWSQRRVVSPRGDLLITIREACGPASRGRRTELSWLRSQGVVGGHWRSLAEVDAVGRVVIERRTLAVVPPGWSPPSHGPVSWRPTPRIASDWDVARVLAWWGVLEPIIHSGPADLVRLVVQARAGIACRSSFGAMRRRQESSLDKE